jgi:mono/diheme cytochrome c family protein
MGARQKGQKAMDGDVSHHRHAGTPSCWNTGREFRAGVPLFLEHCAVCHGSEGDGKGPLASGFSPAPRDFTTGSFKFRSTGVGEPVSESDLVATIGNGITGSYGKSMPAFEFLNERELQSLVEVIRYLSGIEQFGTSVVPPPRPRNVDLARGQALYQELSCGSCHGPGGDGKGELADGLEDERGDRIRPADFRTGQFKGGNAPENIWMRIYAGLEGTPMPAFGRNSSEADIWAVTEYVMTFSK